MRNSGFLGKKDKKHTYQLRHLLYILNHNLLEVENKFVHFKFFSKNIFYA